MAGHFEGCRGYNQVGRVTFSQRIAEPTRPDPHALSSSPGTAPGLGECSQSPVHSLPPGGRTALSLALCLSVMGVWPATLRPANPVIKDWGEGGGVALFAAG